MFVSLYRCSRLVPGNFKILVLTPRDAGRPPGGHWGAVKIDQLLACGSQTNEWPYSSRLADQRIKAQLQFHPVVEQGRVDLSRSEDNRPAIADEWDYD